MEAIHCRGTQRVQSAAIIEGDWDRSQIPPRFGAFLSGCIDFRIGCKVRCADNTGIIKACIIGLGRRPMGKGSTELPVKLCNLRPWTSLMVDFRQRVVSRL